MNQGSEQGGGPALPEITLGQIRQAVWRSLKEMRTVLYLLVIIALVSFLGAVIPQNLPAEAYGAKYGPGVAQFVTGLGLNRVYTSMWYLLLLVLLLLSLVACSGRLWSQAKERLRLPDAEAAARRGRSWRGSAQGRLATATDEAVAAVSRAARKRGFHVWPVGEAGGAQWLYLCRHRWSAYGQPLTHYSIFLIAIGALLGVLPGLSVDSSVDVVEGQTYSDPAGPLPFGVTLHSFRIVTDPKTGAIENYYSDVSIVDGGQEVMRRTISVNHPLAYRHFYLSQSSWGLGAARAEVTYKGKTTEVEFPLQRVMPGMGDESGWSVSKENAAAFVADREMALVAGAFHADAERVGGEVVARPSEGLGKPVIELMAVSGFSPTGKHKMQQLGWMFAGEEAKIDGGKVKFIGVDQSSTFGVRKDYGAGLVWLGFAGCALGMMLIFYFPLRQAVVSFRPAGNARTEATVAFSQRGAHPGEAPAAFWSRVLGDAGSQDAQADKTTSQEELPDE